ncbi:hypothetical protein [uncultured Algibacter sp.]|uniref:hypothetical protein n=1 Tax=uncultured Algibacter sp. TaxID=298659 RepID=UPI00260D7431|nr:hypothetical protein [uncultured Algibacter sp.]
MNWLKNVFGLLFIPVFMMSFSQCASTKKLQNEAPLEIGQVNYQSWVAGIQGGGAGVNLFIPIVSNSNNVVLDSVYFQGKQVKLEQKNKSLFVGRFKKITNQKNDIVMSSNRLAEVNNPIPEIPKKIPFELREDECVVSFKDGKKIKYYKISGILKKEAQFYPKAPPRN